MTPQTTDGLGARLVPCGWCSSIGVAEHGGEGRESGAAEIGEPAETGLARDLPERDRGDRHGFGRVLEEADERPR